MKDMWCYDLYFNHKHPQGVIKCVYYWGWLFWHYPIPKHEENKYKIMKEIKYAKKNN